MRTPVDTIGKLLSGEYAGWFVKVEESGGGYLVLICEVEDFKSGKGYDNWVLPDRIDLYFLHPDWQVDWRNEPAADHDAES